MPRLNENITKSPIVIFAGGGASDHLGYPVGSRFLAMLREQFAGSTAQDALFRALDSDQHPNFEYIYDYVDRLCELANVVHVPVQPDLIEQITAPATDYLGPLPVMVDTWAKDTAGISRIAQELRNRLSSVLIEQYGNLKKPTVLEGSCWPAFLRLLHPGPRHVLPVFTTNYDLAFEDLDRQFAKRELTPHDAIDRSFRGPKWVIPAIYDAISADGSDLGIVIFRLHGCVAWQELAPESQSPDGAVAEVVFDGNGRPVVDPEKAALVWPSPTKLPFTEPFWQAHMYLVDCLQSARLAVFIGYGFADTAIAGLLQYATQKNHDLRIVLMDSDSKVVDRAREAGLPVEEKDFLEYSFKKHTREIAEELLSRDPGVGAGEDAFKAFEGEIQHREHPKEDAVQEPEGYSNERLLLLLRNGVHEHIVAADNPGWSVQGSSLIARRDQTADEFHAFVLPFSTDGNWDVSLEFRLEPSSGWGAVALWWRGMGQPFVAIMKEYGRIRVKQMSGYARMPDRDRLLQEVEAGAHHWHRITIHRLGANIRMRVFEEGGAEIIDYQCAFGPDIWHGDVALVTTELPHNVQYRNINYSE